MQFADERHHIGHVLNHVTADDLVELVIGKWVRHYPQIVDDIGVAARVGVNTDGARILVLTTAHVKNLLALLWCGRV